MCRQFIEDMLLSASDFSEGKEEEAQRKIRDAALALDAYQKGCFAWHMLRLETLHEVKQLTPGRRM